MLLIAFVESFLGLLLEGLGLGLFCCPIGWCFDWFGLVFVVLCRCFVWLLLCWPFCLLVGFIVD